MNEKNPNQAGIQKADVHDTLKIVEVHYKNPDASHFEEPSALRNTRRELKRMETRFLSEKNPHD